MALEPVGVVFKADGGGAYITTMAQASKATEGFTKTTAEAGKAVDKAADLWQDAQGRWRTTSGRFASDAEKAAGGVQSVGPAAKKAADDLDHAGGRFGAAGQIMVGALRQVGVIAVEAFVAASKAAIGFVGDSISLAADFEQTMNVLGATTTQASLDAAGGMSAVSAKAKELGNDLQLPSTSAVDAGEAMLELVKAGFEVQEAMDAAKGTLQLAAAAQIEEAQAAEISSNAINAFGLEAKDAMFVSDLLAASANASSVEITDVAQSYQMAGAIFSNFQGPVVGSKQAIVDLTTAVGILGNAGIKGSDAGTSLKQALLQLTGPSDNAKGMMRELAASIGVTGDIAYDAQGNMRSFPEILGLTAQATANLTEEQRNQYVTSIFGADASRAILVLMQQGPAAWDAMTQAVTRQGAAQDLAAAQTKGLKGAWEGVQSQVETLQLTIGQALTPVLTELITGVVQPAIGVVSAFADSILSAENPMQALIASIDQVVPGFSSLVGAVQSGGAAFTALQSHAEMVFGTIGEYIPAVMATIQEVVGAVTKQVAAFWKDHGDEVMDFVEEMWSVIEDIYNTYLKLVLEIVIGVLKTVADFINDHGKEIQTILSGAWQVISNVIKAALALIQGLLHAALDIMHGDWAGAWESIQQMSVTVTQAIGGIISGFLDIIAGFFGTSLAELVSTWSHNFDQMKAYVMNIDWLALGVSIIDGMTNGALSKAAELVETVVDAVRSAYEAAKDAIGMGSPAKLFIPVGYSMDQGMAIGAEKGSHLVTGAVARAAASPVASAMQIAGAMRGSTTTYNQQRTLNMPIYTNMTPGAIQQSAAIAGALLT